MFIPIWAIAVLVVVVLLLTRLTSPSVAQVAELRAEVEDLKEELEELKDEVEDLKTSKPKSREESVWPDEDP